MSYLKKIIFALLGIISTALGIIGVWVPGLPNTVFIILALWLFTNSSNRLYNWLLKVPLLNKAVAEATRFQCEGTISLKIKLIAQMSAWISFVVTTLLFQSLLITLIVGLAATACSVFMYITPPTTREQEVEDIAN